MISYFSEWVVWGMVFMTMLFVVMYVALGGV